MEERFSLLVDYIREMGEYARKQQKMIHRSTKEDGTFVTETDLYISRMVTERINGLYPEANVITEENPGTPFRADAPFTFILDPIDGTTAYSRGMSTWAVSLGIVDKERKAVGAIVYIPRYGKYTDSSFFVREPYSKSVYMNGDPFEVDMTGRDTIKDMITGDKTWRYITFPDSRIKMRSLCSSVVDMLTSVMFVDFGAAINDPGCYSWDVAGTDAILSAFGIRTTLSDGTTELYTDEYLSGRKPYPLPVYAATPKALEYMYRAFIVKDTNW